MCAKCVVLLGTPRSSGDTPHVDCRAALPEWLPAAQVQEQQWLAEAVGGVQQLLPLLLQVLPGGWAHGYVTTRVGLPDGQSLALMRQSLISFFSD